MRGIHFLWDASLSSGDYVHRAIETADLIINIGHDVIEKPPFFMTHGTARDQETSHSSEAEPVLVSKAHKLFMFLSVRRRLIRFISLNLK